MNSARRCSVAWRVNAERLTLLGWGRAILLQFAHPLVAAGVYHHSRFRDSPAAALTRLHHTVRAMLALTFGDEERRAAAVEGIRAIHRRVHGRLLEPVGPWPAGTPYSAEDPELVLWVHATLMDSVPLAYDAVRPPLTPEERDAYCAEAAVLAIDLGARAADVPTTWQGVQDYMTWVYASGMLAVGREAREIGQAMLSSPIVRYTPFLGAAVRLTTLGWLPPAIRDGYGFAWSASDQRRFETVLSRLRTLRRVMPDRLALWRDART